jgi:hypothetical protein
MFADNIGCGGLGCYGGGSTRGIETPRIDQLSAKSIRFTQFCVEPGSAPSRAALPADRPLDGMEQSDYLLGRQPTGNRESLLTFIGDKIVTVR